MGIRSSLRSLLRTAWCDRHQYTHHFIHIPKNGGLSVRYALELNGNVSLTKPFHSRYIDVVNEIGEQVRYFSVVRNPWVRTASRYAYGKWNAEKWPASDPRRLYMQSATFESYVKEQKLLPIPEHPGKPWMGPLSAWYDQLEWLKDERGAVVCDCLRLEHISQDLSKYLGRKISVPHRNETVNKYDYRAMYTSELISVVADTFSGDIEYFGFDFDGPATKNIAVSD